MSNRAFVAAEILDDLFGQWSYSEWVGEKAVYAYEFAMERYAEYGFPDEERGDFVIDQVRNAIWNYYGDGGTCYTAARRIIEAWGHAGLL